VSTDVKLRTYAVGGFLAGCAREKSAEIQTIHRKCVGHEALRFEVLLGLFLKAV